MTQTLFPEVTQPAKPALTIQLADKDGIRWAQETVIAHHYLHKPVDVRSRPMAYHVLLEGDRVGCLMFSRPESTFCRGWYGSVADVQSGKCRLTRWEILNLSRVWLSPGIQIGGAHYIPNAATQVIAQALRVVVFDYLMLFPVVWPDEPYMLKECISYCDTTVHRGTLYRAANFQLVRTNKRGIETYARPVRHLTHAEHAAIRERSDHDKRAQRLRTERQYQQLSWEVSA